MEAGNASPRYWRSDSTKVRDNELLVVSVTTFPVAVRDVFVVPLDLPRDGLHRQGAMPTPAPFCRAFGLALRSARTRRHQADFATTLVS